MLTEATQATAALDFKEELEIALRINGHEHRLRIDARVTLLDLLGERLHLTGTKKRL